MGYRKAADGVASRGKTKGTAVSMGGKTGMKAGGMAKMRGGGESKAMVKKEIAMMKKAKAPKSMIKHEQSEMKGMRKGGYCK